MLPTVAWVCSHQLRQSLIDMSIGQPGLDHPSWRLSSQVILGYLKLIVESIIIDQIIFKLYHKRWGWAYYFALLGTTDRVVCPYSRTALTRSLQHGHQRTVSLTSPSSCAFSSLASSELPHPPQNLLASLSPARSHSVTLSWVRPFDGNSPVLYYTVQLSENSK